MNPNSIEAYNRIRDRLPKREKEVLGWIEKLSVGSCENVAFAMDTQPHKISGRFTRLKQEGLIAESSKGKTSGGFTCSIYKANRPNTLF